MAKLPKYCGPARPSGLGYCWWQGKRKYFSGTPHGSLESIRQYDAFCQEISATMPTSRVTVAILVVRYLEFAAAHYGQTDEYRHLKSACSLLMCFPDLLVSGLSPGHLLQLRQKLIDAALGITTINQRIQRIQRILRWGVAEGLVPATVWQSCLAIDGLRRGRSAAGDPKTIAPVDPAHVLAVLPLLSPVVAAMVSLQRVTGMRTENLLALTPGQIDRRGQIWIYRPLRHKSSYRGRSLEILLGPEAQRILAPFLDRPGDCPCFSPKEADDWHRQRRQSSARIPGRQTRRQSRRLNPRYSRYSYRTAIRRACQRAGIAPWHPHQLRHLVATEIRQQYGLEHAKAYLGHADARVTERYAEIDRSHALDVATGR